MQYVQIGENDLLKRRVYLHLVDATDGITAKTGQTGTCKISVNGNTPTTSVNSIVEIDASNLPGDYYVILDQTEIKTSGVVIVRFKNGNTAEFVQLVSILAFDPTQPISLQPGFNQVVGPDINYKRIREIIAEEVGKQVIPEAKEPNLVPISEGLQALLTEIRGIDIPKQEKVNLSPIVKSLEALQQIVSNIKFPDIPQPQPTDLTPVLKELKKVDLSKLQKDIDVLKDIEMILERVKSFFVDDIESIKTAIAKFDSNLQNLKLVAEIDMPGLYPKKIPVTIKKDSDKTINHYILKEYLQQ